MFYVVGALAQTPRTRLERHRGAILALDTPEALREAYAAPIGRQLRSDADALIADAQGALIQGEDMV